MASLPHLGIFSYARPHPYEKKSRNAWVRFGIKSYLNLILKKSQTLPLNQLQGQLRVLVGLGQHRGGGLLQNLVFAEHCRF